MRFRGVRRGSVGIRKAEPGEDAALLGLHFVADGFDLLGKVGRAETATDPAPLEMVETTVQLKDHREWRAGMTMDKLVEEVTTTTENRFPFLPMSCLKRRTTMNRCNIF